MDLRLSSHGTSRTRSALSSILASPGRMPPAVLADDVRVITFYRSTYYPYGSELVPALPVSLGTPDWAAVAGARPLTAGQRQPHVPGDLGFYDLRLLETRVAQADLARAHGVSAFCYDEAWGYPGVANLPLRELISFGANLSSPLPCG